MRQLFAISGLFCALTLAQTKPVAKPGVRTLPATAPAPAPFDKAKFEAYVRHLLLWGPQITVAVAEPSPGPMPGYREIKVTGSYQQTSLDEIFYLSTDGQKIVRGTVYDIAKSPFAAELGKLKTDGAASMGTEGAPITIVAFSDFQCHYCREEAKSIRTNLLKTYPKEVRYYFMDMPIEQIHPWAKGAAIAGRCVLAQNPAAFWDYHDWIFDKQPEITVDNLKAKLGEWAQQKGLDSVQFSRCYDTKAPQAEVEKFAAEARALRVSSTPTVFINGRPIPGAVPWDQLKMIIDFELDHSKKVAEADEKCCQLSLPVPGKK